MLSCEALDYKGEGKRFQAIATAVALEHRPAVNLMAAKAGQSHNQRANSGVVVLKG